MQVVVGSGSLLGDQTFLEGGEAAVHVVLQIRLQIEEQTVCLQLDTIRFNWFKNIINSAGTSVFRCIQREFDLKRQSRANCVTIGCSRTKLWFNLCQWFQPAICGHFTCDCSVMCCRFFFFSFISLFFFSFSNQD